MVNQRNLLPYFLPLLSCLFINSLQNSVIASPTGYYFGAKIGGEKKKASLNGKDAYSQSVPQEKDEKNFSVSAVSGYSYGLLNTLVLGGQFYAGYNPKDLKFSNQWENFSQNQLQSNLELKSKFSCGFDMILGINVLGFVIFASGGLEAHFPQVRGMLSGHNENGQFAAYFGKDATEFSQISFPKVKSTFNLLPSWNIGGGIRRCFLDKIIIGAEFHCPIKKEKDLKYRYACYDPQGLIGPATPGEVPQIKEKKNKMKIATEFKKTSFNVFIGIKL